MLRSVLVSSLVAAVSAHQNFHQFWVNDVSPGYQVAIRMPPSNSPVTDVTSNDIACNVDGSTTPSGVETYAASEGDKITVNWDISSHPGPITHFLFGPVDDASQASGVGAGWFKIDELDYQNGTWANEVVGNNGGNYTFSLPTGLESGEYLLRSEMLALHGAQTVGGGQFYIGCAQLKITGTGGGCSPSISLPGAYKAEDDNIYIPDVYNGFDPTTYSAPGGSVAACGGSGSAPATTTQAAQPSSSVAATATSAAASSATAAPISSVQAASSSSPVSASAPAPSSAAPSASAPTTFATVTSSSARPTGTGTSGSGAVALYGQCGGTGYTGATQCAGGSTCKAQNDYYHQCVAA